MEQLDFKLFEYQDSQTYNLFGKVINIH